MKPQIIRVSLVFCLAAFTGCKNEASTAEKKKPNVVLILADDLGIHDLSYTGSDYYETPNIDKIAEEGTVFTLSLIHI